MSSPRLPPEILDFIVDYLCDEPQALRNCSLVAKSWVPRARKHLFVDIKLDSCKVLHSWMKTFPDPPSSPARHTRTVSIGCSEEITAAVLAEGDRIPIFSRAACLRLDIRLIDSEVGASLAPLHRFSPTATSLHVDAITLSCSGLFDLVHSLPLLEDLTLDCFELSLDDDNAPHIPQADIPSISPAFTGTLKLTLLNPSVPTRRLLDLPNGLHFRKLDLTWCDEKDLRLLSELVAACSNTLESLTVLCFLSDGFSSTPLDLSGALKLQAVTFRSGSLSIGWINATLRTITLANQDLKGILISMSDAKILGIGLRPWETFGERERGEWLDLDLLLVRVWESHSVSSRVAWGWDETELQESGVKEGIGRLLPEVTKIGILETDD